MAEPTCAPAAAAGSFLNFSRSLRRRLLTRYGSAFRLRLLGILTAAMRALRQRTVLYWHHARARIAGALGIERAVPLGVMVTVGSCSSYNFGVSRLPVARPRAIS